MRFFFKGKYRHQQVPGIVLDLIKDLIPSGFNFERPWPGCCPELATFTWGYWTNFVLFGIAARKTRDSLLHSSRTANQAVLYTPQLHLFYILRTVTVRNSRSEVIYYVIFQLIERMIFKRNFRDDKRARKTVDNRIEIYAHLITRLNLFYYLTY